MDAYLDFVNEIVHSISDIDRGQNIVSVYLGGSVARGDYVVGASDIDIYIVVKSIENTNEIDSGIQCIAKCRLHEELLSWCPDGVSVTFTTYNDIKTGRSWLGSVSDYYSFQETGKLLYGKEIRQEIVKPTESEIILLSKHAIDQLKQIVRQDKSPINKNKYFVRNIFGAAFSAMFFYLCCNQIYIRGKEKIVLDFQKLIPDYAEDAKEIFCIWNHFCQRKLNEEEIEILVDTTRNLVEKIAAKTTNISCK